MREMDRRSFLRGTVVASLSVLAGSCRASSSWDPSAYQKGERSRVAILACRSYEGHLVDLVRRGLRLLGTPIRGKRVVLKPNLVEFDPAGVINTHPALIGAAAEALLGLGAREVIVAEDRITQVGERPDGYRQEYRLIERFARLRA